MPYHDNAETTAHHHPPKTPRRWLIGVICSALLWQGGMLQAQDQAPAPAASGADRLEAITKHPLSQETWPIWRKVYAAIYFENAEDAEKEKLFYDQARNFLSGIAASSGGVLTGEFANDPIAWLGLADAHLGSGSEFQHGSIEAEKLFGLAEGAARKAIALGDPRAMGSCELAWILIAHSSFQTQGGPLTVDAERRLTEAEELLRHVDAVSPQANLTFFRAYIARIRGNTKEAAELFRRATEEHPRSHASAIGYLGQSISAAQAPPRLAELSEPFAKRFPRDGSVQALHAAALFRDGRYSEAAEAIGRARRLDEKSLRVLGDDAVKAIEKGRYITPNVASGLEAMKADRYDAAANAFRAALTDDPANSFAAHGLSQALVRQLNPEAARDSIHRTTQAARTANEIETLCQKFPKDPELQTALAVSLHLSGRHIDAAQALDRIRQLGGRPESLINSESVDTIRQAGEKQESNRFWQRIVLGTLGAALLWIATMFALGAILAICIPRIPAPAASPGGIRSRGEVWLERFYLLVLSLGLLVFYASVPVVALGLLAVTLALFGLMLVVRIIHFGVLHRGLWATGNILRCALIGPSRNVAGIEATADTHPRLLEAVRAVARRLQTRPADVVYLTPSSSISVHQDGAGPFGLLGRRKRVLEIGISTLPLLTSTEFHSILAHEYGHFTHKDTFYSRFIFQVSASLATSLAVMSAAGGFLNYVNPFYGFWWLYLRAYTLLATGFSRSREFLADRRAAAAYGKQAFISGLTKVCVDGLLFESTIYSNVQELLGQGKAFTNAFEAFRNWRDGTEMVDSRELVLKQLQQTRPKWLDTHPTYSERLAAVADFPDITPDETDPTNSPHLESPVAHLAPEAAPVGQSARAIDLLSDYQAVEAELTHLLTTLVSQRVAMS